ncbi:radical SAM protein [Leptolyngbya ohadii]|uniref:radical SAM protein n=1 Tax=Leptolyngbya ohadii TaxID=1962290 RepID=UPI000B59DD29|nr:radical SAM protein [Leptolyngbya ohadii]
MTESSLGVYWGGFLLNSMAPVEVHLNACSHQCGYCFALLNDPDRRANAKQIFSLLSELWQQNDKGEWKRSSYAAHLLREGYPVVISNRVDPLAANNVSISLPLIETLTAMGIPVNVLTKFGKRKDVEQLFDTLDRPTGFYVSLASLNPDIIRKCEPGAPLPEERLQFIQEAVSRGHAVSVGINPIVPGWIDDPVAIAKAVKDAGASGIQLGKLHFSKKQLENMPARDRAALGEAAIASGLKSKADPALDELYSAVVEAVASVGLQTYTSQQGERSDALTAEYGCYPKRFPTMQEFVNHCHDTLKDGDLILWEDFRDFFLPRLPEGEWGLRDHLNAIAAQNSLNGLYIPQRMTYHELLWHVWQHTGTIVCPANVECFAWAGDPIPGKRNSWIRVEDANQMPILVFKPGGTNGQAYTAEHQL